MLARLLWFCGALFLMCTSAAAAAAEIQANWTSQHLEKRQATYHAESRRSFRSRLS